MIVTRKRKPFESSFSSSYSFFGSSPAGLMQTRVPSFRTSVTWAISPSLFQIMPKPVPDCCLPETEADRLHSLFLITQKVEKPSIGRVFLAEFLLQQRKPYIHISSLSGSISSFFLSFLYFSGMEYPALRNSPENIPLLEDLGFPKAYMRPRMFRGCPSFFLEAFNAQSVLLRDVHGPSGGSPGSSRRPSLCPAAFSGRVR